LIGILIGYSSKFVNFAYKFNENGVNSKKMDVVIAVMQNMISDYLHRRRGF